ncbi:MAG: cofactor-independent phosphoglycerate mutase, partial [Clostridia bacterium]|nr:cofactor-independent phosphoglycerate mutase [Clostridia bacterium]
MKHLIVLADGMADWPCEELGGKTPLQYADTPHFDYLARNGRNGLLKTVPDGFHPGSEVANSSILGYDQRVVFEGRGPLEAASIGVDLADDDLALRCNLISIEGEVLKSHSCGRLETEEGDVLIQFLNEKQGSDKIHFYTGVQYRHLLVVKGGNKNLLCTPPHDIPGKPFYPYLLREGCPEARETAELLRNLIFRSQELLKEHPLNLQRIREGKEPANSIWLWGGGYRPAMKPLMSNFPEIECGAVITAVDLIRGIGRYAGLRVIDVEGATGLYDTNYEGKAQAALDALKTDDFVYLHLEASYVAGHDGNLS